MKSRDEIIRELKRRHAASTDEHTKQCLEYWLRAFKRHGFYDAKNFEYSLNDVEASNRYSLAMEALPERAQIHQCTLTLVASLKQFLG